ncbi:DUF2970 domain-containing protein [Paludibacterium purpuratum]|uniref:DUF2970 family protein n=1 Tax=Paludibacterium purpuratum TaxID=1144873 RepID=A0A4R7B7V8_9NEIS|nr:DUF2970 domain-containing protein [Paludibacterium purpuratum]TDR80593.1 DUF2970 family protein [Paludibacterium purpuratum]
MPMWRALGAVLSAFAGIRKGRAAAHDIRLHWWQVGLAVLLALAGLIGGLLLLVSWVTS